MKFMEKYYKEASDEVLEYYYLIKIKCKGIK